jgi:YggT family protein
MTLYDLTRLLVLVVSVTALLLALGSWVVTTRRVSPFGRTARLIRSLTDPVMTPIERFVLRRGGNPRHAPWWLLGIVIVGGILLITIVQWAVGAWYSTAAQVQTGSRGVVRVVIYFAGQLVLIALIVRVIGSWFGAGRYSRWMRPAYLLTDWLVEPLRRFVPPLGMFDITPIIAWFLLQLLLSVLMRVI